MNLLMSKAEAKHELLFNKSASGLDNLYPTHQHCVSVASFGSVVAEHLTQNQKFEGSHPGAAGTTIKHCVFVIYRKLTDFVVD